MRGGPYNTHLIGKEIVEETWPQAYKHIKSTKNEFEVKGRANNPEHLKESFRCMHGKKLAFFVSSYSSHLWNNSVSCMVKIATNSRSHHFENVGKLHVPIDHYFECPYVCVAEGYDFAPDHFKAMPKENSRSAVVHTTIYAGAVEADELHRNKKKVALSFFLPSGSYATMLIRQIFLRLSK